MLGGQSFCLANAAADNQRYFSNNCDRNTTDENVNPRLALSNQLPTLAMTPPFDATFNPLSTNVPPHCAPSFSAHPASDGRLTCGSLNPPTAQFSTTSCAVPGMYTNSWHVSSQQSSSPAEYFQFGQNTSYQCPSAPSAARHAATQVITPHHQMLLAQQAGFVSLDPHARRLEQAEESLSVSQNSITTCGVCKGLRHDRLRCVGPDDPRFLGLFNRVDYFRDSWRSRKCPYKVNERDLDNSSRCHHCRTLDMGNIHQGRFPELYEEVEKVTDRSISEAVIEDDDKFSERVLHCASSLEEKYDYLYSRF